MRFKTFSLMLSLVAISFAFPYLAHAAIPFFGHIIPDAYNTCPAGWGAVLNIINNIISFLITIAIVFVAPVMIAYGGFLLVINPMNPGGKAKAKDIITSTIVGIVIALSAWLIVDAVMAILYHPNPDTKWTTTWSQLVTSGGVEYCIQQAGALPGEGLAQVPAVITVQPTVTGKAISTVGPNGQSVSVSFPTTQSNASLQAGYTAASKYSAQIASACSGSTIPNCTTVITSLIVAESGGKPTTGCNSSNACGIMQLTKANGGADCASNDTACISTQINKGTQLFQKGYSAFPNIPNALAAYNSGVTTKAGQSSSGLNSAMVASINCPGYYAWQCATNPGGLVETQNYVANICQNITSHGGSCN